jgi:NIMA-interacting peptidyl-prolyl cis-trans isomerase 4
MAKGKAAEKSNDKGGAAAKGKGKGKADGEEKAGKVKGAQSINVRHILVRFSVIQMKAKSQNEVSLTQNQCEKHGKKEEALAKLKEGVKFDDVAREFSEDKARAGGSLGWKKRGDLDPAFEAIAFELEASTVNSPKYAEAKTGFGYHIIMVEGRK